MPKLTIKVSIKNKENKSDLITIATVDNNEIKYKEEDKTLVTYDYRKQILKRENKEIKMIYNFDKDKSTKGYVKIKDLDEIIALNIKTHKIEKNKNNILIHYSTEDNNFFYEIEEIK